ncbi:MAG: glycosyltransferase [Acidobacteria bacterium]|nr:glycosyltransferase [Acidobacteriota bacterium]
MPVVRVYSSLEVGGIERQLLQLLPRLQARGRYRTTLILTRRAGALAPDLQRAGVPVEVLPLRGRFAPRALATLAGRFRALGAQIVHSHVYEDNARSTVASWFAGRPPVIACVHSLGVTRGARRRLQERALGYCRAAVVCVSDKVRHNYLETVGGPADRAVVLYNGVDVRAIQALPRDRAGVRAEFGLAETAVVIVCAARLIPDKDHGLLLDAFAAVAARHPSAFLVLAGGGPSEARLRERCAAADLHGRVVLAGSRSDVPRLLRAADLSVLASRREGFSNVVLESLAAGTPLVVTDVGGNREAMEGERCGRVVPAGDAPAFAAALDALLGDGDLREELARQAAERAWRFDLERTADETEALYAAVLARHRRRRAGTPA